MHKEKRIVSNYDKQVDIGRTYFLKYDQNTLAAKFHLQMDDSYIYIRYLGTPCRIERKSGAVYEKKGADFCECRSFETVMTIYDMLCHSQEKEMAGLSGRWTPVANFAAAGASPSTDIFSQKFADAFSGKTKALEKACVQLDGTLLPRLAGADITARIQAFSFFPVLFQFWEGDDEFAPQIKILWDDQTMQYLNFETTYYLQGDLLGRLLQMISDEEITRR